MEAISSHVTLVAENGHSTLALVGMIVELDTDATTMSYLPQVDPSTYTGQLMCGSCLIRQRHHGRTLERLSSVFTNCSLLHHP